MPKRPITWGTLHVCEDGRGNAPGVSPIFAAALGADLRIRDGLHWCFDATCSIADAIMNFEIFEKAAYLTAIEAPNPFGHAAPHIRERTACD